MATLTQVNEIINRVTVDDQTAESAAQASKTIDGITVSADQATESVTAMGHAGSAAGQAMADGATDGAAALRETAARATATVNALRSSLRTLKSEEATLQNALDAATAGGLDTHDITENLSRVQGEVASTTSELAKMKREQQGAKVALEAWNGTTGQAYEQMNGYTGAMLRGAEANQQFFTGLKAGADTSAKAALQSMRAVGDELAAVLLKENAAQEKLARLQVTTPAAVQRGDITQQDADASVAKAQALVAGYQQQADAIRKARLETDGLTTALEEQTLVQARNTSATKLEGYQIGILMDEAHKFFDQILAGGNPLQAAFYQVPNAVQIMGGLGNSLTIVRDLMTGPVGLALAAGSVGAAIYKLGSYAEGEQQQLAQLSQHLRATRADYLDMADAAEQAARKLHQDDDGLSLSDSRTTVQTIVSVPTVDRTQIQQLTADARNLSTVLGTSVPDAAKTLANALRDPSQAAQQFSQQGLQGFDAGLVLSVQHMQQMGDRAGAISLVLHTLESDFRNANESALTPFQASMKELKDEFGGFGDAAVYAAQHAGDGIVSMATAGIKAMTNLIAEIKKLPAEIENLGSIAVSSAGSFGSWVYGGLEKAVESMVPSSLAHLMQQGNTSDPVFKSADQAANKPVLSNQTNAQSAKAAQDMINQVATEQSLTSDQTYLMHQLQARESSTGQFQNGRLVTSSAGALGAMQVMPDNSAGYDLTDLHGNVSASAVLLKHLYKKYDGDQTLVAMAYNWGEGSVDKWKAKGADPNAIPQATQDYIADTTQGASYGPQALAGLRSQSDAYLSKGDAGTAGQMADLQRTLAGEQSAKDALNQRFQSGDPSAVKNYAENLKILDDQIDATKASIANLRDPMQQLAHSQDLAAQSAAGLTGYDRQMISVAQQADQAQLSLNGTHASAAQVLAAQRQAEQILAEQWQAGTAALSQQAAAQDRVVQAYAQNNTSLEHATHYAEVYQSALESFKEGSPEFVSAVNSRTEAMDKLSSSQHQLELMQQTTANDNQIAVLQTEAQTLGMNDEARQKLITHMQAEQDLRQKNIPLTDQSAQAYLASVDALSDATAAYQKQQQVMDDVTGSLSNMADTISDDITQGFVQGTSSGMSFKNVLKGIESQVMALVVKMGLINPLLNSIDGKSRTTLDDITKVFSKTNSSSSGGLSDSEIQQYMSSGSSANDNNMTAEDQMSLFGNTEPPASEAGTSSNGKTTGSNGMSVSDIQSLFGSGQSASSSSASGSTASFGSMSDMFSGNGGLMSSSGQDAASSAGGMMSLAGGIFGGFTTGYSLGKKASNLTGGGKGGKIGAAVGAGIGTAVGTVFGGPVGGMIGGTVLGAIGGIIGGLFNKTHRMYDSVVGADGQLAIGGKSQKHSADDVTAGLTTDLDSVNAAYADAGITVQDGSYGEVGHYHKGKHKRSTSLQDLLPNIKLQSDDANENLALQQLMPDKFDSVDSYTQTIASIKQLADTMDTLHVSVAKFDDQTHVTVGHISGYTGELGKVLSGLDGKTISTSALESMISNLKSLLDLTNDGAQSLVSQVADLRDKYQQAADQAKVYGLDYQVILDKGNAIAQQMIDAENTKLTQSDQSVQARYLAAVGDQEGADLANADISGAQQRQSLQDEWRGYLGDSFANNQTYVAQMADLDKTLAAERLKIQKTYADQALATQQQAAEAAAEKQAQYQAQAESSITSVFSSLADYVRGLGTSDASPLSVQDQYKLANDNFNADYQAAMGGDYDALSRLQTESQTVLSVDQKWLGSGTDYASAYKDQLTKLQAIGNLGADAFTANLAKQLAAQQVDATLQVKQAVQAMQAAITAELKQFIRVQTLKAA
ncbi:transglycosylase SLT domain-containing protein [Acetobacter indonesiensis]|uniref:transglycosylase SLT domain-containing protein n=1 Tax=Acetobacter indonesiensis TaxID=104101 RepID=UPI001F2A66D3|nr:transglycosylase SLT domain-containing protein [Acetobacter indonesiensis]MCG0995285.1 transglycosylase SLT domain-containing protein [Acetobacter indonesiensis]